jgi:hypothetical protein
MQSSYCFSPKTIQVYHCCAVEGSTAVQEPGATPTGVPKTLSSVGTSKSTLTDTNFMDDALLFLACLRMK